jgi:Spy/CpxP family protein refolding chaperone
MFDGANKAVNLTSGQKARIGQITAKYDAAQRTLTEKAAGASKAFRAALMAEKYDVKNVKRLAAAAEKAESAVVSARIDEWTQLRSVLKARQISECDKMMGRGGPGHQSGGRGGPR